MNLRAILLGGVFAALVGAGLFAGGFLMGRASVDKPSPVRAHSGGRSPHTQSTSPTPTQVNLSGSLVMPLSPSYFAGESEPELSNNLFDVCLRQDNLRAGTQLAVHDRQGTVIGFGQIDPAGVIYSDTFDRCQSDWTATFQASDGDGPYEVAGVYFTLQQARRPLLINLGSPR